ncbi:hypothetical protein [Aquipuribacter sp. MA13-6]|uniref:hypothetical protein n=1 Tax=unclassified Aquipuribacter TaxID=2635084 RepID=UPI003EEC479F
MRLRPVRLPAAVQQAAGLGDGERVLAVSAVDGGWTFATTHALHVVTTLADGGAPDTARRVAWTDVRSATTVPSERVLDVLLVDGARWSVPVGTKPGRLPEAVRERVQNSVVHSRFVEVRRNKGVHVVARRTPEEDVSVQVAVDEGVDATGEDVKAQVEQVRREMTAELRLDERRRPS